MGRLLFSVLLLLFVVCENEGKIYDRCTLARELKSKGIPQDQVDNFVCLVENNSFDTEWTGGPYEDGTKNFGIFQISNNDWCVIGKPEGFCFTDCNDYTDDDITDDFMCAKEIHRRFGFDPFWVWTQKCRPAGPDLSYCLTEGNNGTNTVGSSDDDESNFVSGNTETTVADTSTENGGVKSGSTEPTSTTRGSTETTSTARGSTEPTSTARGSTETTSTARGSTEPTSTTRGSTEYTYTEVNFITKFEYCFSKFLDTINNKVVSLVKIFYGIKSR